MKTLDGTRYEVDIINMSFGGYLEMSDACYNKIVHVALDKTIIAAAGRVLLTISSFEFKTLDLIIK